jgi:hypothetical protein
MLLDKNFITKIFKYGFVFVLILVLLDLLTYFYYPNTVFSEIFLATREQTPLTWVSVIVLFLIGLSCAVVYEKTKNKIWYFLSLIYLFFSMDDATYFHERLRGGIQMHVPFFNDFPSYSWILLYFPLVIFGLGGMLYMLWKGANSKERKLLLVASSLLAMAIALDMLDGLVEKNNSLVFCLDIVCNESIVHIFRLIEEVLEVFGFGMFAYLNLLEHSKK